MRGEWCIAGCHTGPAPQESCGVAVATEPKRRSATIPPDHRDDTTRARTHLAPEQCCPRRTWVRQPGTENGPGLKQVGKSLRSPHNRRPASGRTPGWPGLARPRPRLSRRRRSRSLDNLPSQPARSPRRNRASVHRTTPAPMSLPSGAAAPVATIDPVFGTRGTAVLPVRAEVRHGPTGSGRQSEPVVGESLDEAIGDEAGQRFLPTGRLVPDTVHRHPGYRVR